MIRVEDLDYRVGEFTLRLSLSVAQGEYFVLLGPTGAGKTALLECLCGLRRPEGGRVVVGGREVTLAAPRERQVGYLPQDSVLFPHLSVAENIGFAMRMRNAPRRERRRRVEDIADRLQLRHLLDRRVTGLSGGERQRVALGRALAARPQVLLLDEPVSALDEEHRDAVLDTLRHVHRRTGITILHVCHSLEEMGRVAGRVGVLWRGRLLQEGEPEHLRAEPADGRVARLFRLGTVIAGRARPQAADGHGQSELDFGDLALVVEGSFAGEVEVLLRASRVWLAPRGADAGEARLPARVASIVWRELTASAEVSLGACTLRADLLRNRAESLDLRPGREVAVGFQPGAVEIFTPGARPARPRVVEGRTLGGSRS